MVAASTSHCDYNYAVVDVANSYANPSLYNAAVDANSNAFAVTVAGKRGLQKPDVGQTPDWNDTPAWKKEGVADESSW